MVMLMKLAEIVEAFDLDVKCCRDALDTGVACGYASDLLSDVLANSGEGAVWITLQTHQNIVAIAGMKGHAGIVLINGREPEEDTLVKAEQENVPIMVSKLSAFDLVGRLYEMGVRGAGSGNED